MLTRASSGARCTIWQVQRGCREEEPPLEQVAVGLVELERARDEEGVQEEHRAPRPPHAQREPANKTVQERRRERRRRARRGG